jgi:FtsZ-interacting cell division protein ZipA
VSVTTKGFNIHNIGVILMVVGIIGLGIAMLWPTVWTDRRNRATVITRRDGTVLRESDVV